MRFLTRPSLRTSIVSCASSGESSTRSISIGRPVGIATFIASTHRKRIFRLFGLRPLGDPEPEQFDLADHLSELFLIHGLGHAAVGVKVVGFDEVLFLIRRGHNDHRNPQQGGVFLDFRQHLMAVHLGQVQVEQDEVRRRGRRSCSFPLQVGDRFGAPRRSSRANSSCPLSGPRPSSQRRPDYPQRGEFRSSRSLGLRSCDCSSRGPSLRGIVPFVTSHVPRAIFSDSLKRATKNAASKVRSRQRLAQEVEEKVSRRLQFSSSNLVISSVVCLAPALASFVPVESPCARGDSIVQVSTGDGHGILLDVANGTQIHWASFFFNSSIKAPTCWLSRRGLTLVFL